MGRRTELFLSGYFRLLALTCSAQKPAVQQLLSSYLALVLGDMLRQVWRYFTLSWEPSEGHSQHQKHFGTYAKIIDAMSLAYLLAHMLMLLQALLLRNRERRLLAQLPSVGGSMPTGFNLRLHVALECFIVACATTRALFQTIKGQQLLPSLRELYTTQAVRARYLQMSLMVVRLDIKLLSLQHRLLHGHQCSLELRTNYAHILRLMRQLSRIYGLSVLLMNVLCMGDFIVVCYAYIILWRLTTVSISWLLLWQTVYVVLPTIIKIWTLCAVCDSCAQRSKQLLVLINGAWRRQPSAGSGSGNGNAIGSRSQIARKQTEDFSLQIMQNSVQFEVCGIYHLNLKTLSGMLFFIIDSLVIFLQFIGLTEQQRN
ncbi:hypothetical protein AWZ03_012267 [Drosophila navojoa]|uniref:Gustatory receptor n=1 Tax=Drosophila navojoa TaxID=7232 RepID=A0A484B0F6_DRONA|nr:putative gustatory receptor 9a [Drosophila navojoa]TDG41305.1 hypothetical protein AWZ03_012267 [Drosophila navojoa]